MKYSKSDEIIFNYIVKGLVALNKDPNYIKKILEDNNLCNKTTLKYFHHLTWQLLKIEWNTAYGWIEALSDLSFNLESISDDAEDNIINSDTPSQVRKENIIIINKNKKIPYIEKHQLDDMVLNQDVDIQVSPNDAATLLKNIAVFQSKLNEIITSINTIAELINGETRRTPLVTAANDNDKKNEIAYSENSSQVILINMATIQSKVNEIARTIRTINESISLYNFDFL